MVDGNGFVRRRILHRRGKIQLYDDFPVGAVDKEFEHGVSHGV